MREDANFKILEVNDATRIGIELSTTFKSKGLGRKRQKFDYGVLYTTVKTIKSLPDLPLDIYIVYTGRGKPSYKFKYQKYKNPYNAKYLASVIQQVNGCDNTTAKYICEQLGGQFHSINNFLATAPKNYQLIDAVQYFSSLSCNLRDLINQIENRESLTELSKLTQKDSHSAFVYFSKAGGPRPIGLLAESIWTQSLEEGTTYFDLLIFIKWLQQLYQPQSKGSSTQALSTKRKSQKLFYLRPTTEEVSQLYRALNYLS